MVSAALKIGERFGVPTMLLLVLVLCGREVCHSLHSTVLKPMVESHMNFLKSVQENQETQTATLDRVERVIADIHNTVNERK
jgi:hypothetical protein